jgi:ribose transport system substrate-binding protein
MKKHVIVSILCIALAALALIWGLSPVVSTRTQVTGGTVALLLDTDIGAGALQMKQGAKQAAREQKVDLITATADYSGDSAKSQADMMMQLLEKNVKALILVPVQGADLTIPIKEAERRKVPVLTLGESPITGGSDCTISANHQEAGALAAKAMLERMEKPGRLLLITGDNADVAAGLRKTGAMPVLLAEPDLQIVSETPLDGKTADDVLNLLAANPQINGILVLTGSGTETCALAMGRSQMDIPLVGMDCGQNRSLYLESGQVDAMVLGMPFAMGYLGVQFSIAALSGQNIPGSYYTESRVIDRENMYLPENQKLAFPLLQ